MADDTLSETVVACRDLMFVSKVIATARARGREVRVIRDAAKVPEAGGRRLILDLALDGAVDAAVAWRAATGGEVIAFVAHTDADAITRAKAAGIDRVMTRGQFTAGLESLFTA